MKMIHKKEVEARFFVIRSNTYTVQCSRKITSFNFKKREHLLLNGTFIHKNCQNSILFKEVPKLVYDGTYHLFMMFLQVLYKTTFIITPKCVLVF